ncbi:MAG TPA: hypothetical protein VKP30_19545 [Polyangiaceae bacterium]|nr:hypothetical protein [Polyangiaceae bacterium]
MSSTRDYPLPLRRNAFDPALVARDCPSSIARGVVEFEATLLVEKPTGADACQAFTSACASGKSFLEANRGRGKSLYRVFRQQQAQILLRMLAELERTCAECGIIGSCSGRIKSPSSTWRKMQSRGISRREVFDSIGLRVVVSSIDDCYRLLQHIQLHHEQIDSQIRDYIACPKANGYQSLHVTVFDEDGALTEIQLRTTAMHEVAERGTAAHAGYKAAISDHFLRIPEVITSARVALVADSPGP